MSFFDHVTTFPDDPIFGLAADFRADPRKDKVDLVVGVYRTEDLKPYLLKTVKEAESIILESEMDKGYLPIKGSSEFIAVMKKLTFGEEVFQKEGERIFGAQTVGGTGALRLGGEFVKAEIGNFLSLSSPTWANHAAIFKACGFIPELYPYYNPKTHSLDFDQLLDHVKKMKKGSTFLMQVNGHNPTGLDFTKNQWRELSYLLLQKEVFPFFDFAYQGFSTGIREDAFPISLFFEEGHEFMVTNTCAKSFGIYGERTGAIFIVSKTALNAKKVESRIKNIIRSSYSVPPKHGAAIVSCILSNPELKEKWEAEVGMMRSRVVKMRTLFADKMIGKGGEVDYQYLKERSGFFSMTGVLPEQATKLAVEYGVYMTKSGRVNVTGLNHQNIDHVVSSLFSVTSR
ncbi:MAG: aspartate/tyrosine/aromatic aminotransferase [Simkaniaceae bacterium]|nr:aspartate/tyrosine/aromatic aminotransferase [Simkaniaceae bacterium]